MAQGKIVISEDGVSVVMNPYGPLPSQEIEAQGPRLIADAYKLLPRAWAEVFPQMSFDWREE